ncbi:MAG: hypothetical protein JWN78_2922 [Bacteroidota bacterium]|nr:hypothetical protein [Bacteroidota bacterium]
MKRISILLLMFIAVFTAAAQKYYTSSGVITFTSEAPMEKIISSNKQVTALLNTATKEVAFKVLMKSFKFDRQGMYDHFNREYTESDKFPNAMFEGKITDAVDFTKNGTYNSIVDGKLTIHGVTKPVKQSGTVEVVEGKITLKSNFNIQLSDYGIKVPSDFIKRISNTVQVTVNTVLTPYVR